MQTNREKNIILANISENFENSYFLNEPKCQIHETNNTHHKNKMFQTSMLLYF